MNDFLLIFRRDYQTTEVQPSSDQLKEHLKQFQDWFAAIAAEGKLSRPLQRWDGDGRVLRPDKTVINGPYAEIKESIGGLIIIKAENYEQALEIARDCPVLKLGGTVEIRMGL